VREGRERHTRLRPSTGPGSAKHEDPAPRCRGPNARSPDAGARAARTGTSLDPEPRSPYCWHLRAGPQLQQLDARQAARARNPMLDHQEVAAIPSTAPGILSTLTPPSVMVLGSVPPNGLTFSRKPREPNARVRITAARGLAAATFCYAVLRINSRFAGTASTTSTQPPSRRAW